MSEKEITDIYKKSLKEIEKVLGKSSTNNVELYNYGRQLLGKRFIGVFSQDTVPTSLPAKCFFIFNQDKRTGHGIHWLACYKSGKTFYVYDSFGRKSKRLVPTFVKRLESHKWKYKDTDDDPEQTSNQSNCGARCMAFLICTKKYGIRKTILI
jgi:hypothetical protein